MKNVTFSRFVNFITKLSLIRMVVGTREEFDNTLPAPYDQAYLNQPYPIQIGQMQYIPNSNPVTFQPASNIDDQQSYNTSFTQPNQTLYQIVPLNGQFIYPPSYITSANGQSYPFSCLQPYPVSALQTYPAGGQPIDASTVMYVNPANGQTYPINEPIPVYVDPAIGNSYFQPGYFYTNPVNPQLTNVQAPMPINGSSNGYLHINPANGQPIGINAHALPMNPGNEYAQVYGYSQPANGQLPNSQPVATNAHPFYMNPGNGQPVSTDAHPFYLNPGNGQPVSTDAHPIYMNPGNGQQTNPYIQQHSYNPNHLSQQINQNPVRVPLLNHPLGVDQNRYSSNPNNTNPPGNVVSNNAIEERTNKDTFSYEHILNRYILNIKPLEKSDISDDKINKENMKKIWDERIFNDQVISSCFRRIPQKYIFDEPKARITSSIWRPNYSKAMQLFMENLLMSGFVDHTCILTLWDYFNYFFVKNPKKNGKDSFVLKYYYLGFIYFDKIIDLPKDYYKPEPFVEKKDSKSISEIYDEFMSLPKGFDNENTDFLKLIDLSMRAFSSKDIYDKIFGNKLSVERYHSSKVYFNRLYHRFVYSIIISSDYNQLLKKSIKIYEDATNKLKTNLTPIEGLIRYFKYISSLASKQAFYNINLLCKFDNSTAIFKSSQSLVFNNELIPNEGLFVDGLIKIFLDALEEMKIDVPPSFDFELSNALNIIRGACLLINYMARLLLVDVDETFRENSLWFVFKHVFFTHFEYENVRMFFESNMNQLIQKK